MKQESKKTNNNETVSECLIFELNGEMVSLSVDPSKRLIDVLRKDLNKTGTKISCGIGRCGACMVLVNGKPHNSCLTMAYQCEGKKIETIERISEGRLDQIQQIFLEEGGFQCGYCTPGMVISLKGVLNECPNPTVDDLKVGLSGNLCRCTGYGGILRSLERICEYYKE